MPNWCSNYLTVSGDTKKLEQFDNQFKFQGINVDFGITPVGENGLKDLDLSQYLLYKTKLDYQTLYLYYIKEIKPTTEHSFSAFIAPPLACFLGDSSWNQSEEWGTKWDIQDLCDPCFELGETEIAYSFLTAWGPPEPIIKEMIKSFPDLSFYFDYEEGGSAIAGKIIGSNGEVTEDKHACGAGFRKFLAEELGQELWKCPNCGDYLYESETEEDICSICEKPFHYDDVTGTLIQC